MVIGSGLGSAYNFFLYLFFIGANRFYSRGFRNLFACFFVLEAWFLIFSCSDGVGALG